MANGKPAKIIDTSMSNTYKDLTAAESPSGGVTEDGAADQRIGEHAFEDLTDRQNDEFVYVL